jgi:hypothetical protein
MVLWRKKPANVAGKACGIFTIVTPANIATLLMVAAGNNRERGTACRRRREVEARALSPPHLIGGK